MAPAQVQKSKRGTFDGPFERLAAKALRAGLRPNHLTFAQIPVFLVTIWAANNDRPWLFVSLIIFVIILDGGDGILARVGNLQSRVGAFLDAFMDTIGIAIVLWGASMFHPEATLAMAILFIGNTTLYLQNMILEEKVVSYVRGPALASVAFPDTLIVALFVALFIMVWLLVARMPRTLEASREEGNPFA